MEKAISSAKMAVGAGLLALCIGLSACVPPQQSRRVNYPAAPAQTSRCDEELEAYCLFSAPANDPQCAECGY